MLWSTVRCYFLTIFAILSTVSLAGGQPADTISLVVSAELGAPVQSGVDKIEKELTSRGIAVSRIHDLDRATGDFTIVLGMASGSGPAQKIAEAQVQASLQSPESFAIERMEWKGTPTVRIMGSDERGLMYGALHVAERIGWADPNENPLARIQSIDQSPDVADRSITKVVTNPSEFEQYFYSERYWNEYLEMLAESRFNNFHLLFGYRALGYFEPIYPFLFDVEEFPNVQVIGLSSEKQKRNLEMLKKIVELTHAHGLDFTLGLWTHIYRVDDPTDGVPFGLTDDNLIPYSKAALGQLLQEIPEIDAIQFRVHTESALSLPQQRSFWREMLQVIHASDASVEVDMRAKGFTDDMITAALSTGVDFRIVTKYWGEQMGLPYHPTHLKGRNQFKRRHGYADILRYPRRYPLQWRLWNHGTTRLFLWGSPEYARRFARSANLWNGEGYDVYEPLATKMWKHRVEQTFDILLPEHQFYEWEFQRYWHFYQVFGRLGYDIDTPETVWHHAFTERFGAEAGRFLERGLHVASRILPRIVAYHLPELSASRSWAEFQQWEALPDYIKREPSDPAQFLSIRSAAKLMVGGGSSPKIWPQTTSRWFRTTADSVIHLIQKARETVADDPAAEFATTLTDLEALASLAQYHASRIQAGLQLALHEETGSLHALDKAIDFERRAVHRWETLVETVDGVYADSLIFGRDSRWGKQTGHWRHQLTQMRKDLEKLEARRDNFDPANRTVVARFDFGDSSVAEGYHPVPRDTAYPRSTMGARIFGVAMEGGRPDYGSKRAAYGWRHHYTAQSPKWRDTLLTHEVDQDFVRGPDPYAFWSAYNHSAFTADMPNGSYRLDFSMANYSQSPKTYGPMWIVANGRNQTDRFTVKPGRRVEKTLRTEVTGNRLNVVFKTVSTSQWLVNSMRVTRVGPSIAHVPVREVAAEEPLTVEATIGNSSPIKRAQLWYARTGGDYRSVPLQSHGRHRYRAEIPAAELASDVKYFLEVVDHEDRRITAPRQGSEQPIQAEVRRDTLAPSVTHEPVASGEPGKSLQITAQVRDTSGIESVQLKYRSVSQYQDYYTRPMMPTDSAHAYTATVPGSHIPARWDFMYYIEVMDENGNGTIYPDLSGGSPYIVVPLQREN